jgi:3-dehydroquinate synthase
MRLKINLSSSSYDILIENNILDNVKAYIMEVYNNKKIFIVTDDNVKNLYLDKVIKSLEPDFEVDYVSFPQGEESKNINVYSSLCEQLIDKGIRRNHLLIALGGGVVGDMCGFIAATLYRGIPYVGIPTSLLSQMDSSIGGKTGIDFYGKKNILGCFNQPKMVLIDPKTLDTLDKREFNNGMGELIKHAIIGNPKLWDELKNKPEITDEIIYQSLSVKKRVVEEDEFDTGLRMMLNFGHTFGHVIEMKYGYKHGEAVGVGMLMALNLGVDLGVTPNEYYNEMVKVLKLYDLPCDYYDYKEYLKEIIHDKKNLSGVINFILVDKIGSIVIHKIDEDSLKG